MYSEGTLAVVLLLSNNLPSPPVPVAGHYMSVNLCFMMIDQSHINLHVNLAQTDRQTDRQSLASPLVFMLNKMS